jgi:hypothetical protein
MARPKPLILIILDGWGKLGKIFGAEGAELQRIMIFRNPERL